MNRRQRRKKAHETKVKYFIRDHDIAMAEALREIVKANLRSSPTESERIWSRNTNAWAAMTTSTGKPAKGDKSLFHPSGSKAEKPRFTSFK